MYRANPPTTETVEVDLMKKPGKNLGLTFRAGNPKGIVITSLVRTGEVNQLQGFPGVLIAVGHFSDSFL